MDEVVMYVLMHFLALFNNYTTESFPVQSNSTDLRHCLNVLFTALSGVHLALFEYTLPSVEVNILTLIKNLVTHLANWGA